MKKEILLVVILAVIIVILLGFLFWPTKPANNNPVQKIEGIEIISPKINEEISSPLKITGKVSGNGWSGFEGQVGTVQLLDYKGNKLAEGVLTAITEWTALPTSFSLTLNFTAINSGPATLVFKNENASGDPARDKTFFLPVKVKSTGETMTVRAFFGKKDEPIGSTCTVVFPIDRVVPKTEAVAKTALEELLKGPTDSEKQQGYYTNINPGVKIQNLTIDNNGMARADFSSELESTGGSCRVTEIRSEINFTLKQFSAVKSVIISINGRTEDILQP